MFFCFFYDNLSLAFILLSTELPKLHKPFKPLNVTLCSADCQLTTGDCRNYGRRLSLTW